MQMRSGLQGEAATSNQSGSEAGESRAKSSTKLRISATTKIPQRGGGKDPCFLSTNTPKVSARPAQVSLPALGMPGRKGNGGAGRGWGAVPARGQAGNQPAATRRQQGQLGHHHLQFWSCFQWKDPEQATEALERNIKHCRNKRYCSRENVTRLKPSVVQPSDEMEMSCQ